MKLLKQIWYDAKHQPVIMGVSILGTAFAVFLIMAIVMMDEVKTSPFPPEVNRDRTYYCPRLQQTNKEKTMSSSGGYNRREAELFYGNLPGVEAMSLNGRMVWDVMANGKHCISVVTQMVDSEYWKIYEHRFIHGMPFDSAAVLSDRKMVVISENLARKLYGTTDVVGREMKVARIPYEICGVVEDVSPLASQAYADCWIASNDGYYVRLLLGKDGDINEVKDEIARRISAENTSREASGGHKMLIADMNTPLSHEEFMLVGDDVMTTPDTAGARNRRLLIFGILLVIPAINLAGMSHSRMRKRVAEIGVRRAFGCTRAEVLWSVLCENMMITAAGAAIGLMASVAFALWGTDLIFGDTEYVLRSSTVYLENVMHWSTFGWVVAMCCLLNVLSAGVPAWLASRTSPVAALSGSESRR